jgi:hypothetical protein
VTRGQTSSPSAWRRWLALAVVIVIVIYARAQTMPPDVARKPPSEPKPPGLKEATIYIWGSKKGPYTLTWKGVSSGLLAYQDHVIAKNKVTGTIGGTPKQYHVDFSKADRPPDYFDVEVWKTEDWEGDLKVALRANGKILWCDDTDAVASQLSHLGIFFVPEDLKRLEVHAISNFFVE